MSKIRGGGYTRYLRWMYAILLAVLLPIQAQALVWSPSTGPEGGAVNALAVDPTTPATLYAGTFGGVFKSTDSGANWTAVNTGITTTDIQSLVINPATPSTLYAGTFNGGVFKS